MSTKGTSRSNPRGPKLRWWLGPAVVYLCMLSAMLLTGMIASALGLEASIMEKEENVPFAGENLTFKIVTPEGLLSVENDTIVITLEFTNPTENSVSRTYVLNLDGRENSIYVPLSPGENKQIPFKISASGLTAGFYTLSLTDPEDNHLVGKAILRWGHPREASDVISHAITYSIALSVVYLHVSRYERRKKFWNSVGIKRENLVRSFILVFALAVVFSIILFFYWEVVKLAVGGDPQQAVGQFFANRQDWYYIYLIFGFFVPVALTEELVFRGFMLDRFLVKGAAVAIVLSSALFTSLHLWYAYFGVAGIPLFGGLFLISVYWGIVYWKTGNIVGLIVFHGLTNLALPVKHFLGEQAEAAMSSAMFILGVICLGYLLFVWLRGLFAEIEQLVKGKGKV